MAGETDEAERIRRLEAEVAELRRRLDRVDPQDPAADWRPVDTASDELIDEAPSPPLASADPPQESDPHPHPAAEVPGATPVPFGDTYRESRTPRPSARSPRSLEETLGGNWLPKAGIVVLVLGVVFLFKYAVELGWIGLRTQIVLGVAAGLLLVGLGDLLLAKGRSGRVYPQVLSGGGFAITYFSIYAAYVFEDFRAAFGLSLEVDALLLALVGLLGIGYAVYRDLPTLSAFAGVLVMLTVLVAYAWNGFAVTYHVLALALLVLAAAHRRWTYVPPVLVVPAFVPLFAFLYLEVLPYAVGIAASGVALSFVLYGFRARAGDEDTLVLAVQSMVPVLTGVVWMLVVGMEGVPDGPAWVAFAAALGFGGLALVPLAPHPSRIGWGSVGMAFALAWPPLQFDGTTTVFVWTGYVLVGLLAFVWRHNRWSEIGLLAATLLMTGHLVFVEVPQIFRDELPVLRGLIAFLAATLVCAGGFVVMRGQEERQRLATLGFLGLMVLFPVLYFGGALEGYAISIAWTVQAVLLVVAGFAFRAAEVRYASFGVFGLVLGRVFLVDITTLEPVYRIITFLVVGAILVAVGFLFARRRQDPPDAVPPEGQ